MPPKGWKPGDGIKVRKCKYCPKPVKRNYTKGGRYKGSYTTCGSPDCVKASYRSAEVNNSKAHLKDKHPKWLPLGATRLAGDYIVVKVAVEGNKHDMWRRQHEIVAEQILGRPLNKGECVHHINMIKTDNRPENIYIYESMGRHTEGHFSLNKAMAKLITEGKITFKEGAYYAVQI